MTWIVSIYGDNGKLLLFVAQLRSAKLADELGRRAREMRSDVQIFIRSPIGDTVTEV